MAHNGKLYFDRRKTVLAAYRVAGSWEKVAKMFGFGDKSMWQQAAKGKMSVANENRMRLWLRLPPRRILRIEDMSDETIRLYMETRQ